MQNFTQTILLLLLVLSATPSSFAQAPFKEERVLNAEMISTAKMGATSKTGNIAFSITLQQQRLDFNLQENKTLIQNSKRYKTDNEMLILKGAIAGNSKSWARFVDQNGVITGAFFDGDALFLVEKLSSVKSSLERNSLHGVASKGVKAPNMTVLINAADIEHNGTCALHDETLNTKFSYNEYIERLETMLTSVASKEINITVVADTEYVTASSDATADMIGALNIADGIFSEQLDVQLTLSESVELSNNGTLTSTDPEMLINDFRQSNTPNPGLRHLFTGKDLNGTTVGIAYVGSLCFNSSVGITQRYGSLTSIILAHELGHNFGAPHDNQGGSACSSTGSGFIMNPSINGGLSQFSACSIEQMNPVITQATTGFNACITEIDDIAPAPVITSVANLVANVGESYQYDADNTVDVESEIAVTYSLDIAPEGMEISAAGLVAWTPSPQQYDINPVQIRVSSDNGEDTQYFEIIVNSDFINFAEQTFTPFASQYQNGQVITSESDFQVELTGNNWQSMPLNYNVTVFTVLEFEFRSDVEGEIQGVSFENDSKVSSNRSFQLFGSQNWGISTTTYVGDQSFQKIIIPVGSSFQGNFNQLVFIMDNDINTENTNAIFRNMRIYENTPDTPSELEVDLRDYVFTTDLPEQDVTGSVIVSDDGSSVEITGNRWRKIVFDNVPVTATTVIEFDFKSTQIGEIHGLGFLPSNKVDKTRSFQLYGTQNWGISDFNYNGSGDFQRFSIPVGQYFTQEIMELVFIMDHDVSNPNANSTFRNIVIRDTANTN